jgi:hypothetical protein
MYCDHVAFSQVISRLARLTPETKAHVTGAVLELQGSTLQACDETVDLVSQALQPVTTMPHHVDWCHAHSLSHRICAPMCVPLHFQEELLEDSAIGRAAARHQPRESRGP